VVNVAPKKKWRFLQKYWHKGAFFQAGADGSYDVDGADPVYLRDYSAPTGEDKMDKTMLPAVMQVYSMLFVCLRVLIKMHFIISGTCNKGVGHLNIV
jgi:Microfibril-associated/Pre-mRNA processing